MSRGRSTSRGVSRSRRRQGPVARYWLGYSLAAAAMAAAVFALAGRLTDWPFYGRWLTALSAATFVIYGTDKLASKAGWRRAPELILHALAALGGCAGGWAGMFLFHHKSNYQKHRDIWLVLVASTLGHAALAYLLLLRGG